MAEHFINSLYPVKWDKHGNVAAFAHPQVKGPIVITKDDRRSINSMTQEIVRENPNASHDEVGHLIELATAAEIASKSVGAAASEVRQAAADAAGAVGQIAEHVAAGAEAVGGAVEGAVEAIGPFTPLAAVELGGNKKELRQRRKELLRNIAAARRSHRFRQVRAAREALERLDQELKRQRTNAQISNANMAGGDTSVHSSAHNAQDDQEKAALKALENHAAAESRYTRQRNKRGRRPGMLKAMGDGDKPLAKMWVPRDQVGHLLGLTTHDKNQIFPSECVVHTGQTWYGTIDSCEAALNVSNDFKTNTDNDVRFPLTWGNDSSPAPWTSDARSNTGMGRAFYFAINDWMRPVVAVPGGTIIDSFQESNSIGTVGTKARDFKSQIPLGFDHLRTMYTWYRLENQVIRVRFWFPYQYQEEQKASERDFVSISGFTELADAVQEAMKDNVETAKMQLISRRYIGSGGADTSNWYTPLANDQIESQYPALPCGRTERKSDMSGAGPGSTTAETCMNHLFIKRQRLQRNTSIPIRTISPRAKKSVRRADTGATFTFTYNRQKVINALTKLDGVHEDPGLTEALEGFLPFASTSTATPSIVHPIVNEITNLWYSDHELDAEVDTGVGKNYGDIGSAASAERMALCTMASKYKLRFSITVESHVRCLGIKDLSETTQTTGV